MGIIGRSLIGKYGRGFEGLMYGNRV